jgi:hypothetical protein
MEKTETGELLSIRPFVFSIILSVTITAICLIYLHIRRLYIMMLFLCLWLLLLLFFLYYRSYYSLFIHNYYTYNTHIYIYIYAGTLGIMNYQCMTTCIIIGCNCPHAHV